MVRCICNEKVGIWLGNLRLKLKGKWESRIFKKGNWNLPLK
jgi:hypothetical protein